MEHASIGETVARRPRTLTAHQLAFEKNKNQQVEYILSSGLRKNHHYARKQRLQGSAIRRRTEQIKNPFDDGEGGDDSSREDLLFRSRGFGGPVKLKVEEDDYGEEMSEVT